MKKLFFVFAVILFTTLAASDEAIGQQASGHFMVDATTTVSLKPVGNDAANENRNDSINTKALSHFKKSFKTAKDVKWMLFPDGFLVKCIYNDIHERVFYYKKGNLLGTVKGYTADNLTEEIRRIIKNAYPGYLIVYVDEAELATMPGSITYFVHLQIGQSLKVIRVCDGEMDVFLDTEKNISRF